MNHVCPRLGVSERRACRVMGHARSTHRYLARLPDDEPRLVSRMIELATTYGRYESYRERRRPNLLNQATSACS